MATYVAQTRTGPLRLCSARRSGKIRIWENELHYARENLETKLMIREVMEKSNPGSVLVRAIEIPIILAPLPPSRVTNRDGAFLRLMDRIEKANDWMVDKERREKSTVRSICLGWTILFYRRSWCRGEMTSISTIAVAARARCQARFASPTRGHASVSRLPSPQQDGELLLLPADWTRRITVRKVIPRLHHLDYVLKGTLVLRRWHCDVFWRCWRMSFWALLCMFSS